MSERCLSSFTGPISTERGLKIAGQPFDGAIGIIGGATLLEALIAAKENPKSAVVVIDSIAAFGQNLLNQLVEINRQRRKTLDWQFFEESSQFQYVYEALWKAHNDPKIWGEINRSLVRYSKTAASAKERIFFVPKETGEFKVDEAIFDEIQLNYPGQTHYLDPTIYGFIAEGLKSGGQVKIATEGKAGYLAYFAYAGRFLTEHGSVKRPEGIKKPLSLYDLIKGQSGYFYVNIQSGNNPLPAPSTNSLYLRNTPFGMAFAAIQETFSKKRRNIIEK